MLILIRYKYGCQSRTKYIVSETMHFGRVLLCSLAIRLDNRQDMSIMAYQDKYTVLEYLFYAVF